MLPILKHTCIYLNRDVQCIVIYMYIYLYTVCEGIQSRIRIQLFKNCERSELEKYLNLTIASEASRSIWEKLANAPPPPPQIVGKLKSDYLFSSQKRTDYLFSTFSRSEYLFQQNASPPPQN